MQMVRVHVCISFITINVITSKGTELLPFCCGGTKTVQELSGCINLLLILMYIIPDACTGDTVAVETATRGTEVGPTRGTYVNKEKQKY